MAANTRAKAGGFGLYDQVTHDEMQTIQVQAASAPSRTNTTSGWRIIPLTPMGTTSFLYLDTGTDEGYAFDNTSVNNYFELPLLPHGHVLAGVKVHVKPGEVHGPATQPANLPHIGLYKFDSTAKTVTLLAEDEYSAAGFDLPTYEAGFDLEATCTETIDRTKCTYLLTFRSEYGADSANLVVQGAFANVTVDTSEGGPDFLFW